MERENYDLNTSLLNEEDKFEEQKLIPSYENKYPEINEFKYTPGNFTASKPPTQNISNANYAKNVNNVSNVSQPTPVAQQAHSNAIECGHCRAMLAYPQNSLVVICPLCNASTATTDLKHLICGACNALLLIPTNCKYVACQ